MNVGSIPFQRLGTWGPRDESPAPACTPVTIGVGSAADGRDVRVETSVDAAYVQALVDGNPKVEQHFHSHFGRLLYIKLRRRLGRSGDVDDVRQETFLRVLTTLRNGAGLRNGSCLGGFVNSVCENILHERARNWKREPLAKDPPADLPDARDGAEAELVRDELVQEVRRVLGTLSAKDQAILTSFVGDGNDRDSVCAEYRIDRRNLRVILHRAKKRFRKKFECVRNTRAAGGGPSVSGGNGGSTAGRGTS